MGTFVYGNRVCQVLNKYDFLSTLQIGDREGWEGKRRGGVMMDLGEAAKTIQWASESWNLRSRFTHHTHTHTHTHSHHTPHRACFHKVVGSPEVDPVVSGLCNQLVKEGGEILGDPVPVRVGAPQLSANGSPIQASLTLPSTGTQG